MKRLAWSERLSQEAKELMEGYEGEEHPLDEMAKLGARFMIQKALEEEVNSFLGRGHYRHGRRRRIGWRNGYEPGKIKMGDGILGIYKPQVRDSDEKFVSRLKKEINGGTERMRALVSQMYIRGLSTRDIEGMYKEVFGDKVFSRSQVSRMTKELEKEFSQWQERDLSGLNVVYLFLDGHYQALRQGVKEKEGILCAYGFTREGKKVLLHLALGNKESYDCWKMFLQDMAGRGLNEPILIISDRNPGLKKAVREMFPHALKQRCLAHKMRNIMGKLPRVVQEEMKKLIQQVFYAKSYQNGLRKGKELIKKFEERFPSAMKCLEKDLEECLNYMRLPKRHWRFIRTTNAIERLLEESRRRSKVIPRFPTEKSCLKLLWATLMTASRSWKGITMTPAILQELDNLRSYLFDGKRESMEEKMVA